MPIITITKDIFQKPKKMKQRIHARFWVSNNNITIINKKKNMNI